MELIRISDRKLKIMLTPKDMRHFELNADTLGEDSAETHRAFRLLLEEIKQQTGFEADDNHLTIQYFPSREGGCEMFISHLPSVKDAPLKEPPATDRKERSVQLHPTELHNTFRKECAYRFERLDLLLNVCQRLVKIGCRENSSAFCDDFGQWYLVMNVSTDSPFAIPKALGFIVEYGQTENPAFLKLYIREHGKLICRDNAIRQLARLI